MSRSWAVPLIAVLLMVVAAPGLASAQRRQQIHGWVQWITGTRMQVTTDDGLSLAVDLSLIDQRTYQGLRNGDGITVVGVVSADRNRLMAQAIWNDPGLRGPGEAP
jgi:hypothetical protein